MKCPCGNRRNTRHAIRKYDNRTISDEVCRYHHLSDRMFPVWSTKCLVTGGRVPNQAELGQEPDIENLLCKCIRAPLVLEAPNRWHSCWVRRERTVKRDRHVLAAFALCLAALPAAVLAEEVAVPPPVASDDSSIPPGEPVGASPGAATSEEGSTAGSRQGSGLRLKQGQSGRQICASGGDGDRNEVKRRHERANGREMQDTKRPEMASKRNTLRLVCLYPLTPNCQ